MLVVVGITMAFVIAALVGYLVGFNEGKDRRADVRDR